jgi:hypothetical protein
MADGALFIGWGEVVRGREAKSLEVFNEAVQYWGSLQQAGTIESFDVVILHPHGGDLAGFALAKGDEQKLHALLSDADFQRINARAQFVVDRVGVVPGFYGDSLTRGMATFQAQIADLGG